MTEGILCMITLYLQQYVYDEYDMRIYRSFVNIVILYQVVNK